MNCNTDIKDLTQYSIRCASILGEIFDSIQNFSSAIDEEEKNIQCEKMAENITNFELTLDSCFVDVNESIDKIGKAKLEKKMSTNTNSNRGNDSEIRNNQNEFTSSINDESITDEDLINSVVVKISNIKLKV